MQNELINRLEREGLRLASFGKRALAFLIDKLIIALIIFIIFYKQFSSTTDELEIIAVLSNFSLSLLLLEFSYHFIFTFLYGATAGKMLCKIVIVSEALLDKPSVLQAAIRALVRLISENAFMLGFAWAFANEERKTWHDLAAKTVVIELA